MDNLSHSLVGLAGGELIHRCLPTEQDSEAMRLRRRLLLFSCWFASNFPDLDLVLTPLLPEPLGYLLHHRGHTHTFLYALPQALLVFATIWILVPAARTLFRQSKPARLGIMLSIALGLMLHIAMDYLNSYGIHPFHPFDSRWYYGDMVFIVEPVFWVAFGVPLIGMISKAWLRRLLLAALPAALFYFTWREYLLWQSLAALLLLGMLLAFMQHGARKKGVGILLLSFSVGAVFVATQAWSSRHAREVLAELRKERGIPGAMLDAALSPFPANPLCWTFVSIENDASAGTYSLRKGMLSLAPEVLPLSRCPTNLVSAPLDRNAATDIVFLEHYEAARSILPSLQNGHCHLQAWLRFARAPKIEHGVASDMRFSFRSEDNFTTMHLDDFKEKPCASLVPQWDFPRRDLLTAPAGR
ncbi:MAG: metal-dependent hydrolase [Burkholderiaceae bacterium]